MKKTLLLMIAMIASASFCLSAEKMPAEVKIVTDKMTKLTVDYYKSAGKVKSAKELAAVINRYSSELEKMAPQIKAVEAKYGNAGNQSEDDTDDGGSGDVNGYESIQQEFSKQISESEFGDSFANIQKYYTDPEVQKALEKLSRVMEDIGISDESADEGIEEAEQ